VDKEVLALVSKFLEGNKPDGDQIHVNLTLTSQELKEIGNLLNKLREKKGE